METFTDAAFAFALTLLVLSLDPPTSADQLRLTLLDVPAFLLSGTLLMMFWWGHHDWSRRYGLDDGATFVLSCLLVFTVLVYVYPLRFLFGLTMEWISWMSGLPVSSHRIAIAGTDDVNEMFVIYGVGFVAMSACIGLLYAHAWRRREALELTETERWVTRVEGGIWVVLAGAGLLSIAIGLLAPPRWIGAPGWAYMILPVAIPTYLWAMARSRS